MFQLSYSACERYLQSPMAYFLYYILRLRPAVASSPLVFGGAIDLALNSLLEDKKNNRPIDVQKAKDVFEKAFTKQVVNGREIELWKPGQVNFSKADLDESLLTKADYESGRDLSWCSLRQKGLIIIDEYAKQVLPRIEEVILVQHEISLTNEYGDKLVGVVDVLAKIDGRIWIVDNKTTSVKYDENSANESAQLATYYEALRNQYDIAGVAYITIPKRIRKRLKPAIEIQMIFGQISEDLLETTFNKYDKALTGIRSGDFRCSGCKTAKFGCDYRRYCESGGTDLTGLIKLDKR